MAQKLWTLIFFNNIKAITYLHLLNAFWRLLRGSARGCWLGSTSSGGGETSPGVTGVLGVLDGVVALVGVAPPELEMAGVELPSPSPSLHPICRISPWPSWLRSLRLQRAHSFPGLDTEITFIAFWCLHGFHLINWDVVKTNQWISIDWLVIKVDNLVC